MKATKTQLKNYMIRKRTPPYNTKPEVLFNEYQKSRNMGLVQNTQFPCFYDDKWFTLQLDFALKRGKEIIVDFEIDGRGHKRKWDKWKDQLKATYGLKVIHIDGELCKKRFWGYLDKKIPEALNSKEAVVYING